MRHSRDETAAAAIVPGYMKFADLVVAGLYPAQADESTTVSFELLDDGQSWLVHYDDASGRSSWKDGVCVDKKIM
eukprot:SAG31_NODE_4212_length_3461_cov_4.496728_2_plen_75_part_00